MKYILALFILLTPFTAYASDDAYAQRMEQQNYQTMQQDQARTDAMTQSYLTEPVVPTQAQMPQDNYIPMGYDPNPPPNLGYR